MDKEREQKASKVAKRCGLIALCMFGFSFALVPLYNTFCEVTGLNGKIDISRPTYLGGNNAVGAVDERVITVEFIVTKNLQMPWDFKPQHHELKVRPGEIAKTGYFARNNTRHTMTAQAIPSLSPWKVSKYFKKVECFCFDRQTLQPGETENFWLAFYIDPKIPKDTHRITLSYTLFDVTKEAGVEMDHSMHGVSHE